jgi:tetratricopeptide (TPR) repeat protein
MAKNPKTGRTRSIQEEVTGSLSQTGTSDGTHSDTTKRLLGAEPLGQSGEARALVRLSSGRIEAPLAEELDLATIEVSADSSIVPIVVGPYSVTKLKGLALQGLVGPRDYMLESFSRWKTIREHFPEIAESFNTSSELTDTATAADKTFTQSETDEVNEGLESTNYKEGDELTHTSVQLDMPPPPPSRATPPPALVATKLVSPPQVKESVFDKVTVKGNLGLNIVLGILICLVGVIAFNPSSIMRIFGKKALTTAVADNNDHGRHPPSSWPENLVPLELSDLYESDSAFVRRIRPLLLSYDRGNIQISDQDMRMLNEYADAAASSWEGRVVASNLLAIYGLARGRVGDAKKMLAPLLATGSVDATTTLNMALVALAEKNYSLAKEIAGSAGRLCSKNLCWAAHAILGTVEGNTGRLEDADREFSIAVNSSGGHPIAYGLWLQALTRNDAATKRALPRVMNEALLSDSDLVFDSPLSAPFAGRLLLLQAIEGYKKAILKVGAKLSQGQQAYLNWFVSHNENNPITESVASVRNLLEGESDPKSQVLAAYLYKREKNFESAAELMSRVVPLLKGDDMASSWPFVLAGDIQFERGQLEQSLVFYQSALSRNAQSGTAVLGLAVVARDQGDFTTAAQKFHEAQQADASLLPALLRIRRQEWHDRNQNSY